MSTRDEQTKPPSRLWLRILLGVSLALNLLVLGVVGGAIARHGGSDGMRAPPRTIGAAMFRELPREDRRVLRAQSNGTHGDRHARQKAVALAVGKAVRATPFDSAGLVRILDEQAALRAGFQHSVQQAWLTRLAGMNDAERQDYADRLEHALNRPWFKDRRKSRKND